MLIFQIVIMEQPENLSVFNPKELHSNTSVITVSIYVLYGLIAYLSLPFFVGYIALLFLLINFLLIGKLFYEIEKKKSEINVARNQFFAFLRTIVNLLLLFLILYHMGFI